MLVLPFELRFFLLVLVLPIVFCAFLLFCLCLRFFLCFASCFSSAFACVAVSALRFPSLLRLFVIPFVLMVFLLFRLIILVKVAHMEVEGLSGKVSSLEDIGSSEEVGLSKEVDLLEEVDLSSRRSEGFSDWRTRSRHQGWF